MHLEANDFRLKKTPCIQQTEKNTRFFPFFDSHKVSCIKQITIRLILESEKTQV